MVVSIQQKDRLKKAAFFFAGLGHLQPMLLAATNSDYLLDRFLLERRCSSEYVSRMVTSFIFIEIIATVLIAGFAVCLGLYPDFFSKISREKEEDFRGYLTVAIQWIIFLGYVQIFFAFTRGGEKGHIQWFYYSILFQHFFTCIIGAGIGFIDVDRALWYLMTLPMSPVLIFFYQMLIHLWARKKGLAYPAYLVVKNQIWLGLVNSFMVMTLWTIAYFPGLYNSQPIPDVVEIKIEFDKTDSYDCTTSGPNRVCMLVGSSKGPPQGYTCYRHTPDISGHFKGRKIIVKEICKGCSKNGIKNVSFPEHEFCTCVEVYRSTAKREWVLVKLLMEDGSVYYYCPRSNSGWCVGKLSSANKLENGKLQEILKEINDGNGGGNKIKDSGEFQSKLLNQASQQGATANNTTSYADEIVLNISNTTNYVCQSEGSNKTDIIVTVTEDKTLVPSALREQYTCYTHQPSVSCKLDETLRDKKGQPYPLYTTDDTFRNTKVDHMHVYCKIADGSRVDLLVIVTDDGSRHYYCQNEYGQVTGTKLNDGRYVSDECLKNLLILIQVGDGKLYGNGLRGLNSGNQYSETIQDGNKPKETSSSSPHSLTLDIGNRYPYICTNNGYKDNVKTLISVEGKMEPQICSKYTKFVHRLDSGYKSCIDSLKHINDYLDLKPCISDLVDEVAVYYEGGNPIKDPLLICIKKSKYDSSKSKNEDTYSYYCKGKDKCWYRYVYKEGESCKKVNTELNTLLNLLKDNPLTNNNYSSVNGAKLQSDHANYDYWKVLGNHDGGSWWNPLYWRLSGTFMPLFMHGLAVGAMGSIYPHLVPKTLVSAKHSGTFNITSMFLAPLPHIFNLFLAETKSPAFAGVDWIVKPWYLAWLLYIPYFLSFLLIIFNIHYPRRNACCYIRSHTWLAFLIMLFVSFINEILLAVGRGGIMTQRSGNIRLGGNREGLKNDHSLFNKIAPLMSLSYIPFWLTTSPMIKSYAHSVDQYLSDKDRIFWPTSCCGFWSSFGYWCKCGCHGLYTSLPKLLTFNMRTALTHKDDRLFVLVTSDLPKEEWFTDW
ncbi:hypothetical protein BEWA_013340 [Theileria equi strain WA]|uniref:Uncharacterized protein n=1 Tax=Theileria equi strain WA TaxID=1537102 RepID=L1LC13_THEEQ|nr:hypothetical protein BEWA_013340 [Theileria equi strain WA]EKX72775.1 hypothetical protein BEWA_013340 [Theileria equi strain WA]|eukprot:XP_004832227.1 hypothetical protein BEWA_013340 [Theileria equi strain WA]